MGTGRDLELVVATVSFALALCANDARAFEFASTSDQAGVVDSKTTDFVSVDVWLDTRGRSRIKLIGLGIEVDDTQLAYRRDLSSTGGSPSPYPGHPNDLLFGTLPGGAGSLVSYMEPRIPLPGGFTFDPPVEIVQGYVTVGWVEVNLGATVATATNAHLGTLVFEIRRVSRT